MKKKVKKRPNPTKEAKSNLVEDIMIARQMLKEWRRRGDREYVDKLIAEQQLVIDKAQSEQADIRQNFEQAPASIKQWERKIKLLETDLMVKKNIKTVNNLESLVDQALKLQNELKSMGQDPGDVLKTLLGG